MALVYVISVIMKEYNISYRDGRYQVNRSWYFFFTLYNYHQMYK